MSQNVTGTKRSCTQRKNQITLTTVTSLRFLTFTFWNSYVLKFLRLETLTFSDVTLSDINVVWCFVLSQYLLRWSSQRQHFKTIKKSRNRFQAWRAGTTTPFGVPVRRRDRFLWKWFLGSLRFKNTVSGLISVRQPYSYSVPSPIDCSKIQAVPMYVVVPAETVRVNMACKLIILPWNLKRTYRTTVKSRPYRRLLYEQNKESADIVCIWDKCIY